MNGLRGAIGSTYRWLRDWVGVAIAACGCTGADCPACVTTWGGSDA